MTDPFEALREPVTPVDPDPDFAGRLRMRLTREVFAPPGGTMSQQTAATRVEREPAWPPALTPYIVVSDARRAMDWYVEVFGAQRRGELYVNADGTIGHAEVGIGDAVLMFSEASDLWPDVPVRAPDSPATFSHTLHLEVDDVDASTERARRSGASVEREPADQPYGRGAVIVDPFGHRWMLLRRPGAGHPAAPGRRRERDDGGAGRAPGQGVLPGRACGCRSPPVTPARGAPTRPGRRWASWSSQGAEPEVQLSYRVDDIAAAVERVRAAGGRRGRARRMPYGLLAELRRRPGRDVPPLAADRLTEALERGGEHQPAGSGRRPGPIAIGAARSSKPRMSTIRPSRKVSSCQRSDAPPACRAVGVPVTSSPREVSRRRRSPR